jgi:acyl-CoA thioesterase-2
MQEGRRIFVMSVSFQEVEEGLSHQKPMPQCADPDSLKSSIKLGEHADPDVNLVVRPVPVDFRLDDGGDLFVHTTRDPYKRVWVRAPQKLNDDPVVHETLFAYVSDYGLLWTSLQPHGVRLNDPRLQIASLDHTIWFHRPFRMDEWLLIAMESPNASGGRGLSLAHVYNRSGAMVATVAQEGLIRLRDNAKK